MGESSSYIIKINFIKSYIPSSIRSSMKGFFTFEGEVAQHIEKRVPMNYFSAEADSLCNAKNTIIPNIQAAPNH